MLTLNVELDASSARCLVYKHRDSVLRGKLHIKTGDRLKLRQITLRLLATELVDLHTHEAGSSLHPLLRKSSRSLGTWAIWKPLDSAAPLDPGDHHYAFDIPLPKALDGSITSAAYSLRHVLETRLEHAFRLKPDSVHLKDLRLVQVPMALNLHADDRVSLSLVPRTQNNSLDPVDVPEGHAVCLRADAIDGREPFVLAHVEPRVAVRLSLPRGRVLPAGAVSSVSLEAVPLLRSLRVVSVMLALEEITIVARPLLATGSAAGTAGDAKGKQPAAASMSAADNTSNPAEHNAAALAQACAPAYHDAITRVRELTRSHYTESESAARSLGVLLAAPLNMHVPPCDENNNDNANTAAATALADIRNSHIQVHHQLVYEVEYGEMAAAERDACDETLRVRAVAQAHRLMGECNIVRRGGNGGRGNVVRGTLPVAVVERRIADLWGIRMPSVDAELQPSALRSILTAGAGGCEPDGCARVDEAVDVSVENVLQESSTSAAAAAAVEPVRERTAAAADSVDPPASPHNSLPQPHLESDPVVSYAVPITTAALTQPPLLFNASSPRLDTPPTDSTSALGMSLPPITLPPLELPPLELPPLSAPTLMQHPASTSAPLNGVAWGHMMFQQQMLMFQEQQRLQQEQFMRQLNAQYAQLMAAQHVSAAVSVTSVPSVQSAASSSYETAGDEQVQPVAAQAESNGNVNSPPPDYDELLPPDYDTQRSQPPPYVVMEQQRQRRLRRNT
ncbi:hypothetical protein GGI05_001038 [Coemansia sp. RSA 2603]|nr:hypothetical protein GGI05_001038 [Coemansia sp. RSA 2603]